MLSTEISFSPEEKIHNEASRNKVKFICRCAVKISTTYFSERTAKYLMSICRFVCLSARISRKLHHRTSPEFLCLLPVAVAQFISGEVAMLCTSGFVDDVMFSHSGPYGASRVFLSGESITAEIYSCIGFKFCSTIKIIEHTWWGCALEGSVLSTTALFTARIT